jgi:hypothetical protein
MRLNLKELFEYIQSNNMGRLYFSSPQSKLHRHRQCTKSELYINIHTTDDLKEQAVNGRICTKCFGRFIKEIEM